MSDPLGIVVFLAGSPNRVRVLEALADEPRTGPELREATGVNRATLGRVLRECEARGWVERDRGRYTVTPECRHLLAAFSSMIDTVAAVDRLGELVRWFPFEDVGFELGALRDANVVRPDRADAIRPVTHSVSLVEWAEEIRVIASQHALPALEAFHEGVEAGRLRLDLLGSDEVMASIRGSDPDADVARALVASDRARLYRAGSLPPYNLADNDGTIVFALGDERGAPQGLVTSTHPAVREWFDERFEAVRAEATELSVEDFE